MTPTRPESRKCDSVREEIVIPLTDLKVGLTTVEIQVRNTAQGLRGILNLLLNHQAPFREVSNHFPHGLQDISIVFRVVQGDRLRVMETVTMGLFAGLRIEQGAGNHLVTEHEHQPVDRAHELGLGIAPAHAFRDRQPVQRVLGDPGQQFDRIFPGLVDLKVSSDKQNFFSILKTIVQL